MALMDVAMTGMYVVAYVVLGFGTVLFSIILPLLICCRESESAEERAAEERLDAMVAELESAMARARGLAAPPATLEVELMRHVAPVAAAPVVTKKLGYFPYSAEGRMASEKLVCAICLEVFEHGDPCSEVPACRHLFHRDCLAAWMKSKTTCPMCRGDIVAGSEWVSAADDMV